MPVGISHTQSANRTDAAHLFRATECIILRANKCSAEQLGAVRALVPVGQSRICPLWKSEPAARARAGGVGCGGGGGGGGCFLRHLKLLPHSVQQCA